MIKIKSSVSGKEIPRQESVKAEDIRESLFQFIQKTHPDFNAEGFISIEELNGFRRTYITQLVLEERGELAQVDDDVLEAIKNNSILTENLQEQSEGHLTLGQRMADSIATFGGSWTFITVFFSFLFFWIILNAWILGQNKYDPYPFILLNLILSCLAAIQAPIIMMSQNRQEQKDRQRAEHDYKINLKAELEIKLLSEKIDHLIIHQNKKLLEIQEVQIDYLSDLMKSKAK
jgi:uncharacterized membrane protein